MLENEVWAGITLGGKICAGIPLFVGVFPCGDAAEWILWACKDRVERGRGIWR